MSETQFFHPFVMRYRCRSLILNAPVLILCLYIVLPIVDSILVPTGKLTPIEPAEVHPSKPIIPPTEYRAPAPVFEYTEEHPEPPPLDPSYIPIHFSYIHYLSPQATVYAPVQMQNPSYLMKQDKYRKKYDKQEKLQHKMIQKYDDYPTHLQKKYIYYHLKQQSSI